MVGLSELDMQGLCVLKQQSWEQVETADSGAKRFVGEDIGLKNKALRIWCS
jgi:hypothetical protein